MSVDSGMMWLAEEASQATRMTLTVEVGLDFALLANNSFVLVNAALRH